MKIGIKLAFAFFFIALSAGLIVGIIAYVRAKSALEQETFNKLTAVREMKATQIEDYFKLISDQVRVFSKDPSTVIAMKRFKKGFFTIDSAYAGKPGWMGIVDGRLHEYYEKEYLRRLNKNLDKKTQLADELPAGKEARILQYLYIVNNPNEVGSKHLLDQASDKSEYTRTHNRYHKAFRDYLETFGYYDIFLVDDSTGNIVYTVFKEVDYATSLLDGPLKQTNLAQAFLESRNSPDKNFVKLLDYAPYKASYNAHAAFISCPIYDGDDKIGVLVFQMPIDKINDIMTNNRQWSKVGLGSSGETYIVGDDFTLRNQSRFLIEDSINYFKMISEIGLPPATIDRIRNFGSCIGLQEVRTEGTEAALTGKTDARIFKDYRGVPVLSAYRPLNIKDTNWVIMSEIDEEEAFAHVHALRNYLLWGFSAMLLLIIGASIYVSRKISSPLNELAYDAMEVAKGNFDVEINIRRKDEIGILATSFRKMQHSIKRLIDELKEINHNLENKVIERTQEIHRQKEMVEEKNKEILDSIAYAQRLQKAILPPFDSIQQVFSDSFVLFKPKDIVSGDFYWMSRIGDEILLAVVDCTGHGVPGAMVSVVGANSLTRAVKEFSLLQPSAIMDKMSEIVEETFESTDHEVRDGMDMSLCRINIKTLVMQYTGANNPVWIIRSGASVVEELRPDKQPIGKYEFRKPFTHQEVQLHKGDCVYLFSDGYADQFGGPRGKKYKYKTLQAALIANSQESMPLQLMTLNRQFEEWKGELEQVDDVCVMGIKI
ncbi:MAG: methyl-accepting chemotaxis protein [Bacteroidetes bacterium]|nr:MAG: methyl-accepting chemotaxis protein [Bacteroidota bacterium]